MRLRPRARSAALAVLSRWALRLLRALLPLAIAVAAAPALAAIQVEAPPSLDGDRRLVEAALARALPNLEAFFGAPLARDYRVTIAPSRSTFAAAAPGIPIWGIGVAIPSQSRVVLLATRAAPARMSIGSVAVHEIAHLFIHELGGDRVPRWLDEGIAVYISGEDRGASFWDLARAVVGDNAYYLSEIAERFPAREGAAHLAYYESLNAVQFIVREWGPAAIPRLLRATRTDGYEAATAAVLGMPSDAFEEAWEADLEKRTRWVTWTAGGLPAASLMALLFLVAVARKRILAARKLARWEAEEREELGPRPPFDPPIDPTPRERDATGPGTS